MSAGIPIFSATRMHEWQWTGHRGKADWRRRRGDMDLIDKGNNNNSTTRDGHSMAELMSIEAGLDPGHRNDMY